MSILNQGLISNKVSGNTRMDPGTGHPFFSDTGKKDKNNKDIYESNVYGYDNNPNTLDRYSKKKIISQVSKFNSYYSIDDSNVTNTYNNQWGGTDLEKRVYSGATEGGYYNNGRIDGVGVKYIPSFHSNQDNEKSIYNNFASESVKGNFDQTEFSRFYFSEQNVTNLQRQIKATVYKLSQGKFIIDNQSDNALKTVMRSYFLQYKISTNKRTITQINEVNNKVIKWCADEIFSNLLQYDQYKKDINTLPQNINRPLNMSIKGTNASFDLSSRNDMRN